MNNGNPQAFVKAYELALASQDWTLVEPLISPNASVSFSDGSKHLGKENVQKAFERNFSKIKNEHYKINNVHWLKVEETYAVYFFDYAWSGIINGESASGSGIGTSVIIKENDKWQLLTEHLGKKLST